VVYAFATCTLIFIVPGQIFFLTVYEGARGAKRGFALMLGVLAAETLLLLVLFAGIASLLSMHLPILKVVGAILLVWFGLSALWSALKANRSEQRKRYLDNPLVLGFLFMILNPPFIVWLLTVGVTILSVGITSVGEYAYPIFTLAVLIPSSAVMLIIALLAAAGRNILSGRGLKILSAVSGIAFLILAVSVMML
jgi:threonine/homoserine/homoserine lactone efflux protein